MTLISFLLASLGLAAAQTLSPVTTWAPIPSQALGPNLTNGWRVESFGQGAYMVTDNQYNGVFLVSNQGVIVVDAPPTIGRNMLYAIGNTTTQPITHVVYSHSHADHIGGAYLYGKKVVTVAHALTKEILSVLKDPKRPVPDVIFTDSYTLRVGNQTLQLDYKGLNHQPGNIFIWAPVQKALMVVDVIYPGWAPFAYLGQAEFVPGVIAAHDQALAYPFKYFVGGHLTRSGSREDVKTAREYIFDLKQNCEATIAATTQKGNPLFYESIFGPVQKANPNNPWSLFKAYLDDVTNACANTTNAKWLGKLAAIDTWGFENAYAMVESLRIDFDVLGPFGVQG
jgi:glyoxylase-like metal-dependent hydrolase (beta-lactamase superfamily II)